MWCLLASSKWKNTSRRRNHSSGSAALKVEIPFLASFVLRREGIVATLPVSYAYYKIPELRFRPNFYFIALMVVERAVLLDLRAVVRILYLEILSIENINF
ncbi:hypothetical protein T12_9983 [Trichinella patagoniensis]|uniref:Uncharacterized protein n=1 Tax=Trichinella patagoniensis TaxID=990121 RepID=A0A0V1ACT2_9BILA|nr:hypothetical protein T12_9983 [Trichinella patagoniensis]